MRFLTNHVNPEDLNPGHVLREIWQSHEEALGERKAWLEGKIIGEPRATEKHSVQELKAMGRVGIYAKDNED